MQIDISISPKYNAAISRNTHIALTLQWLEDNEVQNLEKKDHMIMEDGELATMMKHQEEDKAHKLMEK